LWALNNHRSDLQCTAFDEAVISEPPFDAVIHTASPYHFHAKDAKELLDPAIIGTTGILTSVQKYAPSVKRVVVTSSFAAINNIYAKGKGKVYSEVRSRPIQRLVERSLIVHVSRPTGVPLQKNRPTKALPTLTEQARHSL
jgi:nucleoside-diphosphate-sugar epimerase